MLSVLTGAKLSGSWTVAHGETILTGVITGNLTPTQIAALKPCKYHRTI